jgi:hypothetical protein
MTITYNTNPAPNPFGSSQSAGLDIGYTTFLGLAVSSFSVQADWRSRGGSLEVVLVEDENLNQKIQDAGGNFPVMGSPQKFELKDTSNVTIFSFAGILDSISSSYSPEGGKTYNVKIASPLRLLENSACIFDGYAGFGYGEEGVPSQRANTDIPTDGYGLSTNGYYQNLDETPVGYSPNYWNHTSSTSVGQTLDVDMESTYSAARSGDLFEIPASSDAYGITYGTNNRSIKWENLYNTINLFGAFESQSHGWSNYATYGGARNQGDGMRLDMIITGLEEIINNTSSSSDGRFHGGNILSGTSTYNICAVASGTLASNPYYYGFDASGFYTQVSGALGPDWLYQTQHSSLLDMVAAAAEEAGVEFIVELDNSVAASGGITQTYPGTQWGGDISIRTLDKTTLRCDRPFSDLAHFVLRVQEPDFGDFGSYDNIHPGIAPTGADVFQSLPDDGSSYTGVYTDPFQEDFTSVGQSASYPYGGSFPVAETGDSRGTNIRTFTQRLKNATINLRDNKDVTSKFVTGGKQSRMLKVPGYHIYQYWGEVEITDYETDAPDCLDYKTVAPRSVPVITPILDGDDISPFVLVDIKDLLPYPESETGWPASVAYKGIYRASPAEFRAAMKSRDAWEIFIKLYRPCMYTSLLEMMGASTRHMDGVLADAYYALVRNSGDSTYSATIDRNKKKPTESAKGNTDQGNSLPVGSPMAEVRDEAGTPRQGIHNIELFDKLYDHIRSIGEQHYGKTWVAWTPYIDTKITSSGDNIMSEYEKSWVPVSDAYLEPGAFNEYQAPQSNKFVRGGRTQSYVNHYYNFATPTIGQLVRNNFLPLSLLGYSGAYDFSEVSDDDIHVTDYCVTNGQYIKAHIRNEVNSDYVYAPYDYFAYYAPDVSLNHHQVRLNDSGLFEIRNYTYENIHDTGQYITITNDARVDIYSGTDKAGVDPFVEAWMIKSQPAYTGDLDIIYTIVPTGDIDSTLPDIVCPPSGESRQFIDDFLDLRVPDHGVNCHHFVRFDTPRVFYPKPSGADGINHLFSCYVRDMYSDLVVQHSGLDNHQSIMEQPFINATLSRKTVEPVEVGVPQQSNRYQYGPWVTDNNFLYAGKVEYVQDDSLVPENFLIPIYGDLDPPGFNLAENFSGTAGVNKAGQAIANAIDGYKPFAVEEGSLTIPGPPIIEKIGDRIQIDEYVGPIVTDIVCRVTANSVETEYRFSSTRDKVGLPTRDMITKMRNASQKRVNRKTR